MRNNLFKLALMAVFGLALTFTFGCSSSEKSNDEAENQQTYPPASDDPSLMSALGANLYRMKDDDLPLGGTFGVGRDCAAGASNCPRPSLPGSRNPSDPYFPFWIGSQGLDYGRDNFYKLGNVAEFLPVPKTIKDPMQIKAYYPSSVGTIFNITDNIHNEVSQFLEECNNSCKTKSGEALTAGNIAKGITIHASVYYGKAAHRDPIVANCTDAIFRNLEDAGNCYTNEYNFYLAWDLKNNSGKLIKVGSYKASTKFYWQIEYIDATDNLKSKKFDQKEFTDTFEMYCTDPDDSGPTSDSEKKCQSKGGYRPWW